MTSTSSSTSNTRITKQAADQKMADGFNKHAQTLPSLIIAGTSYKAADIVAVLQARLSTASRLRVLAVITESDAIQRILAHLGLASDTPPFARARDPTDDLEGACGGEPM
jgi:hypothetical protein